MLNSNSWDVKGIWDKINRGVISIDNTSQYIRNGWLDFSRGKFHLEKLSLN